MPRERIRGLKRTVLQVLEDNKPRTLSCQEIYAEVARRKHLTNEQMELTYGQPNFQHSVRRRLSTLVEEREVDRVRKGEYRRATR